MNKKTVIIAGACAAAALALGGAGWYFFGRGQNTDGDNVVYVNTVERLMELGSGNGMVNRFAGVVESQDTWSVQQNSEKTVKEVLVEEGQQVQAGTPLFTYDVDKFQSDLEQAELDKERIQNEISSMRENVEQLQKDKKKASKEDQASLQLQIQEAQLQLKQKEYEAQSKQLEIDKLNENINHSTVNSEIDGVVKSINQDGNSYDMYGNSDNSFITILSTGAYRVKGKINEQNIGALTENSPVLVRSRVDEDTIWRGTITKIDREKPENSNSSGVYYSSGDTMTQTSSYPFYVALDSSDGLMLGQHVYIELDYGQEEEPKAGVWLDAYFISDLDSEPYVWADNGKGKLEKREVTLGQYDEELGKYEIADGLLGSDAVTFPEEGLEEGMDTVVSEEGMMGQSNPPGLSEEGNELDGGLDDGAVLPEGADDMMLPEGGADGADGANTDGGPEDGNAEGGAAAGEEAAQ